MSQNVLVLPTSGTLSGLAAVQDINAAIDTLNTLASGSSAPSSAEPGQFWHDTANKQLKIRSMDNTTWIVVGTLDETNYAFAAPALSATLGIAKGGTGATTAAAALSALLSGSVIPQANGGTGATSLGSAYTFSAGANGYERSPSGRLTQWGVTGAFSPGAAGAVSFPIGFPNQCFNVVATLIVGAGATNAAASTYGVNSNAFFLVNNSSVATTIYWHAEGY